MKLQIIISTETTPAPANYLARLAALESDRESARAELDRAMLALHRWQNRIDAIASKVEKLDIELSMEHSNLAFQLRQERDAKYQPIKRGELVKLEIIECGDCQKTVWNPASRRHNKSPDSKVCKSY